MVSSRSKTAAENTANKRATRSTAIAGTAPSVPDVPKVEQESKKKAAQKKIVPSEPPASPASTVSKSTGKGKRKGGGTYCLCKGEDDGTPMIKCDGGCRNWYAHPSFPVISVVADILPLGFIFGVSAWTKM